MKTISKRFLKGSLAVLLAVVMLFGSCISGFAAVVDNADTSANVDVAETSANFSKFNVIFDNTNSKWSDVYFFVGHGSYSQPYKMTKISNTGNLYALTDFSWGNATQFCFATGLSGWGGENSSVSNRTNWCTNSSVINMSGDYSGFFYARAASGSDGATTTCTYTSSGYSYFNSTQTAKIYSTPYGSSTYTEDTSAGSVAYSTYMLNSNSGTTSSTGTNSATAAKTATVKMTATASSGYTFKGWTTTKGGAPTVTTNPYSYTCTGATTYYACFEKAPTYTATFEDWDGTNLKTESNLASGATPTPPTNPTREGYTFTGWDPTVGPINANTTYTAQYSINSYTATFEDWDGTPLKTQTLDYGSTPTAPANPSRTGYTFTGWSPTVSAITANTTYTAQYSINSYTLNVDEEGATGTIKLDGATVNSKTVNYNTPVAITVTPPEGHKISSIGGGGLNVGMQADGASWTGSVNVTENTTITVAYAVSGSCTPVFTHGTADANLALGATYDNPAEGNSFCKGNKDCSYKSNNEEVATVDANGVVTAHKAGEATITATCDCDATASYKVIVHNPTFTVGGMNLDVYGNGAQDTAAPTITAYAPASGVSYSYSTSATGITVGETNGVVNAYVPDTYTVNVALKYNGAQVATTSFNVSVATPAFSINPTAVTLIKGQTMEEPFVTSADGNPTVTFRSNDTASVTVAGGKATGVKAGLPVAVFADFEYNNKYIPHASANVTVVEPVIEASENSVDLEFGDGSTNASTTVTLTTNASDSEVTPKAVEVESADTNVATATLSGDTITITATGVGSTTITAKFYDAEVEIDVNVTKYDPNVTIYVTDTQDWGKMNIYFWDGNASSTHASMIYIGRNEQNQRVFAYKFDKTKLPGKIIFKQGTGSDDWTNQSDDQTFDISTNNAWYIASCSNNRSTVGRWNCPITLPTVSVNDVSLGIGDTDTVEATATGADSYSWSIDKSNIATVSNSTTDTATVTGAGAGDATLTVRAFIPKPTGWNSIAYDQSTAYPYISSAAEATVSVSDVLYTVNATVQTSVDGTNYDENNTAGGSVTVNGKDGVDTEVSHGKTATLVATANDGYRFVGWYKNGGQVGTATAMTTVAITADTTYQARFVKTYKVSFVKDDTIESITCNEVNRTESFDTTVDANATINFSVTPAQGNIFSHYVISGINGPIYDSSYSITVDSDVTITPVTVPAYTASAQAYTNKVDSTIGGTATVNGANSVELVNGATATFVATANPNYYFAGWYRDSEFTNLVSTDATYSENMTSDGIALHALFVKNFYLANHSTKEHLVTFTYDIATDTYTSTDTDFVNGFYVISDDNEDIVAPDVVVSKDNFTGITSIAGHYATTGYYLNVDTENYDSTKPVTYKLEPSSPAGTYKLIIELTEATKYDVYFRDQETDTLVDSKAERSTVTIPVYSPVDGQYLASATATPATDLTIGDNEITFVMPSEDIYITPTFLDYRYISFTDETGLTIENFKEAYKQGEEVNITVEPASEQVTISDFKFNDGDLTATENADGSWSITGRMPEDKDIEITPIVEAKFAVNSQQVSIGNYGTGVTVFGTVTMTDENGDTLNEGAYVEAGTSVTYTVTNVSSNYTFVGFYSDYSCDQAIKVGSDSTSVTVNADTIVYALFARKQWMTFDHEQTGSSYVKELVYDPSIKAYTLTTTLTDQNSSATAINIGAWFRVTNNTSKWSTAEGYHSFNASKFAVNFNGHGYGATIDWAGNNSNAWKLSTSAASGQSIKFILTPDGNESIDFSAMTTKEGATIYLSSGALTLPGTYSAESVFTTTGITVSESDTLNNMESYKKADIAQAQMIEFKTTLSGDSAANYYIDSFIVYDILDRTYTIVTPNTLGNNSYSGTVYVDSDCYIVPIYFHTDEYLAANNMKAVDVYFDATAIADTNWGPFVSAYAWGSNNALYAGSWPGQLMIPTEDGSSFYTQLEIPDTSVEGYTSVPQGLQFMNYLFSGDNGPLTVPSKFAANFGITLNPIQTYDYREPITLIEEGYDVITFVAKTSEDGYHGDRGAGQSVTKTVTNETNAKTAGYVFEPLVSRDGVTPMDLTGQSIEGAVSNTPEYYVIAKGDILYDPTSYTYAGDTNFDADWAVDWYIFDKDGNYLAHTLSTAMWHYADGENDTTSELEDALGLADGVLDGKLVHISYEAPNNANHQLCYDGQWYANILDDDVYADVMVGLVDGDNNFVIDTVDPTNDADYGEGWLVAQEEREGYTVGEKYASLPISLDLGAVSLTAATKEGYLFVGWYTESNGKYTKISDAYDYETYINMNETYYAMFREIGEGQVVINHLKYDNPTDTVIPSHGGMATMTVEVRDSAGNVLSSGTPSTDISTAVFPATEKETYTITITTTPLMNGEFFAWYTDSFDDAGNNTFEEIGTNGSDVGSTETVTFTYDFTFEKDSPTVINLYSDVTRVTNKADFYYRYLNRFGEWRTYTVRDIELSDDECLGYAGNEGQAYYPTYLTKYTYDDGSNSYGKTPVSGKTVINTENKIQQYAPNDDVTEVFDGTVSWSVESATITPGKSIITIVADQGNPDYVITYTIDGKTDKTSGKYNTLANIEAPATNAAGDKFLYWVEIEENGEEVILTYLQNYRYRIVENKTIKAVYGTQEVAKWTPSINSVTYTREYSDTSDYIYTDYLIAYNSSEELELNNLDGVEYGLILARDPSVAFDGNGDPTFPTFSEADFKNVAQGGNNAQLNGLNYYYYNLSDIKTTNLNRLDYYLSYNNNYTNSKGVKYCQYCFTAVAYIIVDGTVYLSAPEYVNFYDLANEAVRTN